MRSFSYLRADDIDRKEVRNGARSPCGWVHKRAETDKEKVDQWVPLSADARAAVDPRRANESVLL